MDDPRRAKRQHLLPISEAVAAILRARKEDTEGPLVFARDGRSFFGFASMKVEIDRLIEEANGGPFTEGWTLHDLRRTAASIMPRLGVPLPVVESIINHRSGSFRGIVSTYQVYSYQNEMRAALEKLAVHVATLEADNVTEFRRRA